MGKLNLRRSALQWLSGLLTFLISIQTFAAVEIDDLRVDGSTISTASGNVILDPFGAIEIPGLTPGRVPYINASGELVTSAVTDTELGYLSGVTSALQTQINALATSASPTLSNPTFTGTITTPLTASRAITTNGSSELSASTVTTTELDALIGTTGNVRGIAQAATLTNKTIDADLNTITNIENADVKSGAAIAVNKLAALTASRALESDVSGFVSPSTVTSTELATISGATGNVRGIAQTKTLTNTTIDADGTGNSITNIENADIKAGAAIARNKLASGSGFRVVTNDTSGVMTDAAAITASRALVSDANGIPTHSSVTSTELGYVSGVTSGIQAQIDAVSSGVVPTSSQDIENLGIATSVAANALTISLKQADGSTDPAAGSGAVKIGIRSSTLTTGGYNQRSLTAALSTVISSGSTAGHTSGVSWKIYVYAIDNAGTVELAWSSTFYDDNGYLVSTTAEGGAGAADSYTAMYSTTARSNVSFRLIGRIVITEATAGTWASNATRIELMPLAMNCRAATNGVGCLATESARLTSATSSCTINEDPGDWISSATGASSVCTINVTPGIFSSLILCSASWGGTSSDQIANCSPTSTTQATCAVWDVSGAANVNQDFQVTCSGLR